LQYICKTQFDVQPLINVQSSNPCPISTSHTSVPQIYVLFSKSKIGVLFSNLWLFHTSSSRCPMISLTYALTLTNKSAIDLRICKGHRFENTSTSIGPWFEIMTSVDADLRSGRWSGSIIYSRIEFVLLVIKTGNPI
jgi:hypothetical protein